MSEDVAYDKLWRVSSSTGTFTLPKWMSFHLLRSAEQCPRRVALESASYPNLWAGRGYPSRPNAYAFSGNVVHAVTEFIVKKLADKGIPSTKDVEAMWCLRELGGYSSVITGVLNELVEEQRGNPRFQQHMAAVLKAPQMQIPRLRESVQQLLASRVWTVPASGPKAPQASYLPNGHRFALSVGSHFEVELVDDKLGWRGRADCVLVSDAGCELVELKSGNAMEEHQEQMSVYALLWEGDAQRNPTQIPLIAMSLHYRGHALSLPLLNPTQLNDTRQLLRARTDKVLDNLQTTPPPAMPSDDNCKFCQVKLLCDEFWKWRSEDPLDDSIFNDLSVTVVKPADESRCWVEVKQSFGSATPVKMLLKQGHAGEDFWSSLSVGDTIRFAGIHRSIRADGEPSLLTITASTEMLLIGVPSGNGR